jgi:hypothetical protein
MGAAMNIAKIAQLLRHVFRFPQYATDANGNVTGLVGPDGGESPVASLCSVKGLVASVAEFGIDNFVFDGGSVQLIPGITQYVGVNVSTKRLHCLPRLGDMGFIPVAKVTTSQTAVTSITAITPKLPDVPLSRFINKLKNGQNTNVYVLGSSLLEGLTHLHMVADAGGAYSIANGTTIGLYSGAVGGSQAQYALSLIGEPYVLAGAGFYGLPSGSAIQAHQEVGHRMSVLSEVGASLRNKNLASADLVIVGMLANGGTDRDLYHETILRELRKAGVDVLVVTDNGQGYSAAHAVDAPLSYGLYTDGPRLMRLAKSNGCAVADTAAYVAEALMRELSGQFPAGNVYRDTIHMNFTAPVQGPSAQYETQGYAVWAEAMAGVMDSSNPIATPDVKPRLVADKKTPGQAKLLFPANIGYRSPGTFGALNITQLATLGTVGQVSGLAVVSNTIGEQFGVKADQACLSVPAGACVLFGHTFSVRYGMVVAATDCTAEIWFNNGGMKYKTINISGASRRSVYVELLAPSDIGVDTASHGFSDLGASIYCSSGTLEILAIVALTPEIEYIGDSMKLSGTWAEENTQISTLKGSYSDTVGDSVTVSHKQASRLAITVNARSQGGTCDIYENGVVVSAANAHSLVGVSHFRAVHYQNTPGLQRRSLTIKLTAAGAAPVPQNRSAMITGAWAILDR